MDPETVITTISLGLKLVDQFRELVLRFFGRPAPAPSATAEQSGNAIEIKSHGQVYQRVESSQLKMDSFDEVRYRALEQRVRMSWSLFHELFAQLPLLPTDEQVRIKLRMERIKEELCQDFRGMVRMYEELMGVSLPDHYSLYEVCG
jgi:hypothetical protein